MIIELQSKEMERTAVAACVLECISQIRRLDINDITSI